MNEQTNTLLKRKPLDIHLILGTDHTGEELAKININVQLKPQGISSICQQCELKEPLGNDIIFKLDFVIHEGRENGLDQEQQSGYDHDLSPLQNWLKRPKKSGKLQLYESNRKDGKGGVTLQYSNQQFIQNIKSFQESSFHPDINININMIGKVQAWKKNRIKLKTDQMNINISSHQFKMKDLMNLMQLLKMFGDEDATEEILAHPIFAFVKGAEEIQATLKMSPMSKMLDLYEIGKYANDKPEQSPDYPEVIKGLFKSQLRITLIYSSYMALIADCTYQNEAVLMRLLTAGKKYVKYFD